MEKFTEQEKSELARHLNAAVVRKAISEALAASWRKFPPCPDIQSQALKASYWEGSVDVLDALFSHTGMAAPSNVVAPRRLRTESPI